MAVKAVTAANKETMRKFRRKKDAAQAMVSESGDYELLGTVVNYMQESLPGLRPEVYEFSIQDIEANPWKACHLCHQLPPRQGCARTTPENDRRT